MSHLLEVCLDDISVQGARHSLHEDVADVTQDAHGCKEHDDGEDDRAYGIG